MSRARGALCRACLALTAALGALLLLPLPLPLPLPRAPTVARASAPTPGPPGLPVRAAASRLRPDDVFIAVKTTRKNHGTRLGLLLRTWISRARRQVGPVRTCPPPLRPGTTALRCPPSRYPLLRLVSLAWCPGPRPRDPSAHPLLLFSGF